MLLYIFNFWVDNQLVSWGCFTKSEEKEYKNSHKMDLLCDSVQFRRRPAWLWPESHPWFLFSCHGKGPDPMRQVRGRPPAYIWPKGLVMLSERTSSANVVSPGRRRVEMDYGSYSYRLIQPVGAPSPPSLPLSYELWQQKCEHLSARTDYICCACTVHVCGHQSVCVRRVCVFLRFLAVCVCAHVCVCVGPP